MNLHGMARHEAVAVCGNHAEMPGRHAARGSYPPRAQRIGRTGTPRMAKWRFASPTVCLPK